MPTGLPGPRTLSGLAVTISSTPRRRWVLAREAVSQKGVPTKAMDIAKPTSRMRRPLISSLDNRARNFIGIVLQVLELLWLEWLIQLCESLLDSLSVDN
jgi:hypothetical protein